MKRFVYPCAMMLLVTATSAAPPWMQNISAADSSAAGVMILYPANETTIFDNEGNVPVRIGIAPSLAADAEKNVELFLNGKPVQRHGGEFTLGGVERGTHRLQARIIDSGGDTVAESEPVTFYMWQASRLFPGRQ